MTDIITIRKGLDLPIEGTAVLRVSDARHITHYGVQPTDFVGLKPRLLVAEGDHVSIGDPLFCDKSDERIRFCSQVTGIVSAIVRGEKRALLAVEVTRTEAPAPTPAETIDYTLTRETMLRWGLWTMLRQRPFGTVPNPDSEPKAIVVSCFDSAPLAPDFDFALAGREEDFCHGLEALSTLCRGPLHLCFAEEGTLYTCGQKMHSKIKNLQLHIVKGPHPAGNVGPQIARLCPINKGETVWTIDPQDIATLGHLMNTGHYAPVRTIAVAGPGAKDPHYYRLVPGAKLTELIAAQQHNANYPLQEMEMENNRIISGNVLSGTRISANSYLGAYDHLISILPEGDYYDFMGWLMPGIQKFSFSHTFMSGFVPRQLWKFIGMLPKCLQPQFDTNVHGGVRPLVFTGNFEKVFPFDIYPLQLLKACIVGDLELMENLGIYEVEPEDFALCEFIDPSKTDIQPIIREGLEKLRKEAL